jgi:AcrR family transcriptional regulator
VKRGQCEGTGIPARERILAAAFEAFTEHGFAAASTLEIATRACVSKRKLYALFGSKHQMLIACISERARRLRLRAEWGAPGNRRELEASLVKFGSVLLTELSAPDVVALYRLAASDADRSPEVAQALDLYGRQASHAALREILTSARSAGLLVEVDVEPLVNRFMSILLDDLLMTLALGLRERPDTHEIARRAFEASRALVANPKGIRDDAGDGEGPR